MRLLKVLQDVKALLGFSNESGGVQGPGEVVRDMDTKELKIDTRTTTYL